MTPAPATLRDLSPAGARLARLVPQIYLRRDAEVPGRPLLRLLEVLAEPISALQAAIGRLEDDHFPERASAAALPLLAQLVGARLLGEDPAVNRAVIARTVRWGRRKGTLAALEEVLTLTSGWATEVEEAFRSLIQTQDLAAPLPWRGRNALLRDPIVLADPLSRRAPPDWPQGDDDRAAPVVARAPGEGVEHALRRLGRADAGRHAAAPRTVDLLGWARPERAVIRSARLAAARVEDLTAGRLGQDGAPEPGAGAGTLRALAHATDPAAGLVGFALDPLGRPQPLAWQRPARPPDETGGLTAAAHEPGPPPPPSGHRLALLTPTALAAEAEEVAASGSVSVTVDGVPLVGTGAAAVAGLVGGPLGFAPLGPEPRLRFADADRPSPEDAWTLQLLAVDNPAALDATAVNAGAASDENPLLAATIARRGGQDPLAITPAAALPRGGATVAIRLARGAPGRGHRRDAAGVWSALDVGARRGAPLTPAVALDDTGAAVVARLERGAAGDVVLATWRPADPPGTGWRASPLGLDALTPADWPDLDVAKEGPALAAVPLGADALLVVAPTADGTGLGLWRLDDPFGAAPTLARLDGAAQARRPATRIAPAACLHDGRLFVHGGEEAGGAILGDLWSLAPDGVGAGLWQPHRVRAPRGRQSAVARAGGRLLSTPDGLVLIGGARERGRLETAVWRADADPARPRPAWTERPALPLPPGLPGALWARAEGDALHVLAWADDTAPRALSLAGPADAWSAAGPPERDGAPNPPAEGDALFLGDAFQVLGPPPLPPSEVLFTLGGRGHLAFLPALDLADAGDARLFLVQADGSTLRWFPPGEPARLSLRLGFGREEESAAGRASPEAPRIGVPGRLAWRPFRLRQRNLEPWDRPLALDLAETVALDPRLGRVALPGRVARGGRLGARGS